jgi:CRP-like cAMP-binding protein
VWSSIRALFGPRTSFDKALADLPVFSRLSLAELHQIEALVHVRTYNVGETVFEQGDPSVAMFVVIAGEVRVVVDGKDREEHVLARFGMGEMFGELALIDGAPRTATAIATVPTEIAAIARPDWADFVERNPAAGVSMLVPLARIIAARLRALNLQFSSAQEQNWEQYV